MLSSLDIASDVGMPKLPTVAMLQHKAQLQHMVLPLTSSAHFPICCSAMVPWNVLPFQPSIALAVARFVVGSLPVHNLSLHNGTIATQETSLSKDMWQLDIHSSKISSSTGKQSWPQLKQTGLKQLLPRSYAPASMLYDPPRRLALKPCA